MYYPITVNTPLIGGPTFQDIEFWWGIGVINTTITENDTKGERNAYEVEEYADMPDLEVKPKI